MTVINIGDDWHTNLGLYALLASCETLLGGVPKEKQYTHIVTENGPNKSPNNYTLNRHQGGIYYVMDASFLAYKSHKFFCKLHLCQNLDILVFLHCSLHFCLGRALGRASEEVHGINRFTTIHARNLAEIVA